ncbi:MAG: flippase-like domain-containing protein [Chloroflexi bacterium]|nr:flippase-like domain-containing protein [Chloroflexota bacterium]
MALRLAPRTRSLLRAAALAAVVVAFAFAVRDQWTEVRDSLSDLPVWSLACAAALGFANICCAMLSWRSLLLDLGSGLAVRDAARIFFLGQLGKYLPGSVWTVLAQVELGRDHGVPPRRSVAASAVSLGVSLVAGLLLAAVTLPYTSRAALQHYWWALLALPLAAAALLPANVGRITRWLLRLLHREPLDRGFTQQGLLRAFGWQLGGWLAVGLQTLVLVVALGVPAGESAGVALGGAALAWCAGFLAIPVPAGAGVREAVYIAVLAPVLPPGAALAVALVSRAIATLGDGIFAGGALLASRGRLRPIALSAQKTPTPVPGSSQREVGEQRWNARELGE